jgi:hypothetical protein
MALDDHLCPPISSLGRGKPWARGSGVAGRAPEDLPVPETILIDEPAAGVARITFNRPDAANG